MNEPKPAALHSIEAAMLRSLEVSFGYKPASFDKHAIFKGNLIVVSANNPVRVYEPGCRGKFYEMKPNREFGA